VLSDDELHNLREIERRLRWTSPELGRLFDGVEQRPDESRGQRARAKMLVASAAFAGLALLGPRMLNEAETTALRRPPLPQVSPSPSEPAPSVATRITVIDLLGASTTQATATATGPAHARDTNIAVPSTGEPTTRPVERRHLSFSIDSPRSPSNTDRDAGAESESSC
jgi:hypothetical protein